MVDQSPAPSTSRRYYITTSIPYVNADPHVGHALEFVQADALARHRRSRGDEVRFQSGTDDNALKNARSAREAGVPVQQFVDRHADAFEALREILSLSYDDFVRTSSDPRHRAGVEAFWRACVERGDFYRKHYSGQYCVGCEQFYAPEELPNGRCPEHGTVPEQVTEENWFFRLSRYADELADALRSGRIRVEPKARANEALAFVENGLVDFSVSRSVERAHGWGIPVPDDPDQVMYVWWDALGNYLTTLGYAERSAEFSRWWDGDGRRVHVIGKGILRFHAIYWPAMLLSAGECPPTDIYVHDYLTAEGNKLSKSLGNTIDPSALSAAFGADALRWWLLSRVPRLGDTDFTVAGLVEAANADLAGGIGNVSQRVATMVHRYRDGVVPVGSDATPEPELAEQLQRDIAELPGRVDAALDLFDHRAATRALLDVVAAANRFLEAARPWWLAKAESAAASGTTPAPGSPTGTATASRQLDAVLGLLAHACRVLAAELEPFVPELAGRLARQYTPDEAGRLPQPSPIFPRITDENTQST